MAPVFRRITGDELGIQDFVLMLSMPFTLKVTGHRPALQIIEWY
jgi:hypothetical protein